MLNLERIEKGFNEDVAHAGLMFYCESAFQRISLGALVWFFLRPSAAIKSDSWMGSAHIVVLKQGVLERLEIPSSYESPHITVADLVYQVLRGGGVVAYDPGLLSKKPSDTKLTKVTWADLHEFISRHFGFRAALAAYPFAIPRIFLRRTHRAARPSARFNMLASGKVKIVGQFTAIIPTLNRYTYLNRAIRSLLNNRCPPAEIVVVDQTPKPLRPEGYYEEFDPELVKVHYLDQPGQSTSRNHAIRHATNEWLLFWDDDSETWEDMITEHIFLLEHSSADVSTGASLAPWKDRSHISKEISFYHVAPVLDTGNCMMRKETVERVGMFDPAFDKGSGADDNLGKRLYLTGARIVFNPKAIRTHHKAAVGGLRTHGAWWKNKGTLFGPFPLPTESYDFLCFYPKGYYISLCLYRLVTSYRRSGFWMNLLNTLLFPYKVGMSYFRALKLFRIGIGTPKNSSGY